MVGLWQLPGSPWAVPMPAGFSWHSHGDIPAPPALLLAGSNLSLQIILLVKPKFSAPQQNQCSLPEGWVIPSKWPHSWKSQTWMSAGKGDLESSQHFKRQEPRIHCEPLSPELSQ